MATIVCNLQQSSCINNEPQLIETALIKLKVTSSQTSIDNSYSTKTRAAADLGGGWSFLQNLSQNHQEKAEKESVYVHPLAKRSSLSKLLSEKSLELCTESLGSETGTTDIMESTIFSLYPSDNYSCRKSTPNPRQQFEYSRSNKVSSARSFPPPLTTISGSNSLQVRPHREDGRLIIKAMEAPLKHTCLQAERSNGRLRLSLLKDDNFASNFDSELDNNNNVEELESDMNDAGDVRDEEVIDELDDEEDEEEEDDEEEEEEEEGTGHSSTDKKERESSNSCFNVQMLSRCKEGGRDSKRSICHWGEPLWVATS